MHFVIEIDIRVVKCLSLKISDFFENLLKIFSKNFGSGYFIRRSWLPDKNECFFFHKQNKSFACVHL